MRRHFVTNAKQAAAAKTCSTIEETTCPILPFSEGQRDDPSREDAVINIPFSIPVPVNMPASTTTSQGTVSYAIIASVTTPQCTLSSTSQPIHLTRQIISDQPTVQHVRSYPNSKSDRADFSHTNPDNGNQPKPLFLHECQTPELKHTGAPMRSSNAPSSEAFGAEWKK